MLLFGLAVKESTALSNKLVKQMQALTELQRNVSWADHANQGIEAGATTLGSQVRGSAQVLRRAPAEVRVHEAQQHSLKFVQTRRPDGLGYTVFTVDVPPPMKKPRKTPNTSTPIKPESNGLSVKKDLHGKNVRLSPKTSNIMAPICGAIGLQ